MDDEELAAVGLFDPTVDDASRAALLRRCLEIGLTVDEIAAAGDDLVEHAVQHVYTMGQDLLTLDEVAERAGLAPAHVERIARVTGLADADLDEPVFTIDDVEGLAVLAAAEELLGTEAVLRLLRVAEAATARIGDAAISTFLTTTAAPALHGDESGLDLIEANVLATTLLPEAGTTCSWRRRSSTASTHSNSPSASPISPVRRPSPTRRRSWSSAPRSTSSSARRPRRSTRVVPGW